MPCPYETFDADGAVERGLMGTRRGTQHANRNHKAAALAANDFAVRHVFPATRARKSKRIATCKFRNVWRKILCLQVYLARCPADADGELAVYAGRERRRIRFQSERYEDDF